MFQNRDVQEFIDAGRKMAEVIQHVVYSEEDKKRFSKIIKDFNELYYYMCKQTWAITQWRGVKVLKPPTDMWVYQELITEIKPDLIIETGSFHGGSALFMRDVLDHEYPGGHIISIDIDHKNISQRTFETLGIQFYKGSSVDQSTVEHVKEYIRSCNCKKVMVILDSDHEEFHVMKELDLYAPLVTRGSILIVEDGNNHLGVKGAIEKWFPDHPEFVKNVMCEKYMLTFNRDGYWERV